MIRKLISASVVVTALLMNMAPASAVQIRDTDPHGCIFIVVLTCW